MTEHEKKLMNQAPSDPRRRRKISEPSDDSTAAKKKPAVTGSLKTGPIAFTCKCNLEFFAPFCSTIKCRETYTVRIKMAVL